MTTAPTAPSGPALLAAATPPDRDRYADLLRLFSIGMVVLGHWVVALLTVHGAGAVATSLPLMLSTWSRPALWPSAADPPHTDRGARTPTAVDV